MKWISRRVLKHPKVEKGAKFTPVIFHARGWNGGVCAGRYHRKEKMWESLQGVWFENREVTHWMFMPDAPE